MRTIGRLSGKRKPHGQDEGREIEFWFDNLQGDITPQEVRVKIDNNIAKLSRNDAKFFLVNISPDPREIVYLKEQFGEKGAEEGLKKYAANVVGAYPCNFNRPGIGSYQNSLKQHGFQVWKLTKNADDTAVITCGDGTDNILVGQKIKFTDFKFDVATIYVENNVILLPSER